MGIKQYLTSSGRAPVFDFISQLSEETRFEVFVLLRRLESGEILSMPQSRNLASMAKGLCELRIKDDRGNIRVFYYTKIKSTIYLVHALRNKSRIISERDRNLIIRRIKEIEGR